MNIDELLRQSLQLLGLGMGSVFIILGLLIGIISIVSKLVPEPEPVASPPMHAPTKSMTNDHVAAIQAAIHKFRKTRGR
jgi:oxaloacetate decarboxylase gamma subunit